jgi:transposase
MFPSCDIVWRMGHPAGLKRDFKAMERPRFQAARLLEKGQLEAEVARRVGVHRQSVNRWAQQLAAGGRAALKHPGRAGRKPRLTGRDVATIRAGLKRGPEVLRYETPLWTAWRVSDLIERTCGVRYSGGHVWRILRALGWSCQRPTGRALERDEAAIRRWVRVRWPEVKTTPHAEAKRSSSSTKAD